jgi:hypothetical protein
LSKVSTGTLKIFSAQQLMDYVFGCGGSIASKAYDYYKTHSNYISKKAYALKLNIQLLASKVLYN